MQTWFGVRQRSLIVSSALLLSGCATSNCNILSSNHSLGCNAMYAALAVPMAPVALVSNAVDDQRDSARRAEKWRRLQAGEPAAVAACVLGCYDLPEKLGKETEHAVYEHSVEQVIAWWGDHPLPSQMPALMKAYFYKGATLMSSDPIQAEVYLRKAAALSVDPRMAPALSSTEFGADHNNSSYYDQLAEDIQANLIVLRYRGVPGRQPEPAVLKDRCQAVAAWPPAWMEMDAKYNLQLACAFAYMRQFEGKLAPSGVPAVIDGVADPLSPPKRDD